MIALMLSAVLALPTALILPYWRRRMKAIAILVVA
jgi:hypothetical protein